MSKKFSFRYIFLSVVLVFCLTSCFNMKIDLNFDKKSGKMTIDYELNDDYFQLISIVMSNVQIAENVSFDPFILLDENGFKTFYNNIPKDNLNSITLTSVSIKRNDKTGFYNGKIVFGFKDFEKCMALIPNDVVGLKFTKDKLNYTIEQEISISTLDPQGMLINFLDSLKDDDEDFYKLLTEKAEFDFAVQLRSKILKSQGVKLNKDSMGATYGFKVNDILDTKNEPLKFLISF